MKTPRLLLSRLAFSLIELLVVISIIAILASLIFTGTTGAMLSARKVQDRNDMSQIINAIQLFYTEYGKYPIDSTITSDSQAVFGTGGTPNSTIINVLRCVASGTTQNPRMIQFIQPKVQDVPTTVATKACVNKSSGNWYDPWGTQYIIFIDADYAGDINTTAVSGSTAQVGVGVASVGYASVKNPGAPDKTNYLLSWQ